MSRRDESGGRRQAPAAFPFPAHPARKPIGPSRPGDAEDGEKINLRKPRNWLSASLLCSSIVEGFVANLPRRHGGRAVLRVLGLAGLACTVLLIAEGAKPCPAAGLPAATDVPCCSCVFAPGETGPGGADPPVELAYIGPGAGLAFLGSFLGLALAFLMALGSLLSWPFRLLWRLVRRKGQWRCAKVRKVIVLGLDGLDPDMVEQYLREGKLDALRRLEATGCYRRLRTTFPALSPVAWSTFATGVNPGKHNLFDFVSRNPRYYPPELSPSRVHPARRTISVGPYCLPLSRPFIEGRRKSRAFWTILGEYHVPTTILRIPITFPP